MTCRKKKVPIVPIVEEFSWEDKLNKVQETAMTIARHGGSFREVSEAIFSSGGLAMKLFTTPHERSLFVESKQYKFIQQITGVLLNKELKPKTED